MTLEDLHKLFSKAPERFPFQLQSRYPRLLSAVLAKWDTPIECEALLAKALSPSSSPEHAIPKDAFQDMMALRDAFTFWQRTTRRRLAPDSTLRELSSARVRDLLAEQKAPTPELSAKLRQAHMMLGKDDVQALSFLSAQNISLNQRDIDGQTALMVAVQRGSENCSLALLKSNANPHLQDALGNSALHWAAINGKLRLTEMLLYFGANPNQSNHIGATPLSLSCVKSDSSVFQRLYDYGADVSTQDAQGNTPLHKAISSGAMEIAWLLLQAGAPKMARNKQGFTAQEMAEKDPEFKQLFDMHERSTKAPAF